jgi:hypothetical protein
VVCGGLVVELDSVLEVVVVLVVVEVEVVWINCETRIVMKWRQEIHAREEMCWGELGMKVRPPLTSVGRL